MQEPKNTSFLTPSDSSSSPLSNSPPRQSSPREAAGEGQVTSTPARGTVSHPLTDPFPDVTNIEVDERSEETEKGKSHILTDGIKKMLNVSRELQKQSRENESLRDENTSLQEANVTRFNKHDVEEQLQEDQKEGTSFDHQKPAPINPKIASEETLPLESPELKEVKREILSFVPNEEDRTIVEQKLEHMFYVANVEIMVNTNQLDAESQTDGVDFIAANLHYQTTVEKMQTELEECKAELEKEKKTVSKELHARKDLEDSRKEAIKAKDEMTKKMTRYEEKYLGLQGRWEEVEVRLKKKSKEFEHLQVEYRAIHDKLEARDKEVRSLEDSLDSTVKKKKLLESEVKELAENMKNMTAFAQAAKSEKERELMQAETRRLDLEKEYNRIAKELDNAEEKAILSSGKLSAMTDEYKNLKQTHDVLIDREMTLKTANVHLVSNVQILEAELESVRAELREVTRRSDELQVKIQDLEFVQHENLAEKQRSDELHEDLKKSKREVEYLREQLREQVHPDEVQSLQEAALEDHRKIEALESQLRQAARDEDDCKKSIEEFIRKEKKMSCALAEKDECIAKLESEIKEKDAKMNDFMEEAYRNGKKIEQLQKDLEDSEFHFADFQKHANLQYEDQVGRRDEEISHLRQRLVELESYPGQTISVSKKHTSVQTDEIEQESVVLEQPICPDHDHHAFINDNIQKMIDRLEELGGGQRIGLVSVENQSMPSADIQITETLHQVADLIKTVYSEDSVPEIDRFHEDLHSRLHSVYAARDDERQRYLNNVARAKEKIGNQKAIIQNLEDALNQQIDLVNQNRELAEGFREQYDLEVQENKSHGITIQDLYSQMEEAGRKHKKLYDRIEVAHNEVHFEKTRRAQVENQLLERQKDLDGYKMRVKSQETARKADKKTMSSLVDSFNTVCDVAKYWHSRNSGRQRLLDHMLAATERVIQQMNDPDLKEESLKNLLATLDKTRDKANLAKRQEASSKYHVPEPMPIPN